MDRFIFFSSKTCHNRRKFKQFDDKRNANANVETAIAMTRLINFHMVLSILRADSVYFIFHQVSLSKYFKKTTGIQLSLTNEKIPRKDPK